MEWSGPKKFKGRLKLKSIIRCKSQSTLNLPFFPAEGGLEPKGFAHHWGEGCWDTSLAAVVKKASLNKTNKADEKD